MEYKIVCKKCGSEDTFIAKSEVVYNICVEDDGEIFVDYEDPYEEDCCWVCEDCGGNGNNALIGVACCVCGELIEKVDIVDDDVCKKCKLTIKLAGI